MKIIKDKILNQGQTYENVKFVRCLNLGARLENCTWENGSWYFGGFKNLKWKGGTWRIGKWEKDYSDYTVKWKYGKKKTF